MDCYENGTLESLIFNILRVHMATGELGPSPGLCYWLPFIKSRGLFFVRRVSKLGPQ